MTDPNSTNLDFSLRLGRLARGLEANGYYNIAKLCWALAYADTIKVNSKIGVPTTSVELEHELEFVINTLVATGAPPEILTALQAGRHGVQENRPILWTEIPEVFVCRHCGEIILGQAVPFCPVCGAHELTLREFTPVYFLEPLEPYHALTALETAPDELEEYIQALSEAQLTQPIQANDWSIRDLLAHLLVAQGLLAGRVDKILAEENPLLTGVAAWNIDDETALSAGEIFERFRASRQLTVNRLSRLSTVDWLRTAWHDEFGQVTLLQQASYFARHERSHWPQLEAIRQTFLA
jgi:uncharacterized damage-inducible protein DinB